MFFKKKYESEAVCTADLQLYPIIDVRTRAEFQSGHIPSAQNIELAALMHVAPQQLQREQTYYIICASGGRSATACRSLARQGYRVINLKGGMMSYVGEIA